MIDSFAGEYKFLSNFFPCEIIFETMTYASVEHAYQAAKTLSAEDRRVIRHIHSPGQAKKFGGEVELQVGWFDIQEQTMYKLVKQKFTRHSQLKDQLLATGDQELIEGNWWKDTFWGVYKGVGKNKLGKILMCVRSEIVHHV